MSAGGSPLPPPGERRLRVQASIPTVAIGLVIAATAWYLLRDLAIVLRPLLLAVFLCYVIVPLHLRLCQRMPTPLAVFVLALLTAGLLCLLALLIYRSAVELNDNLDAFLAEGRKLIDRGSAVVNRYAPWLLDDGKGTSLPEGDSTSRLKQMAREMVNAAAQTITETIVVGFYLIFLLFEAGKVPDRIRRGFGQERSLQILAVIDRINRAMHSYLRIKVLATLALTIPVTVVLLVFGVKFALLWAVLTFVGNLIPYVGSMVACTLPIVVAFLQPGLTWEPFVVAPLLITIHTLTAYLIEPAMTGKAIDISPTAVLVSLSFWGAVWGIIGMLLAVPLTVLLKIVLENVPSTRPYAELMSEQ